MPGARSKPSPRPSPTQAGGPPRAALRQIIVGHGPAVVGLAVTAVLSGIAEAGILAAVAQVGSALVDHGKAVAFELGPLSVHPGSAPCWRSPAALALVRIALLASNSHLQARLAADVQITLRADLFGSFTTPPGALQSQEREGHLQEMLTSQILQATGGTLQFAALVSSLITFTVLVVSAMLLDFAVAVAVVIVAVALFGLLRPLSSYGRRSAKELSRSQLEFAGGVGEAVRMAEETHVFGVEDEQRRRIAELTDRAGALFFQTQFVNRLVPTLFQSLVYLTVIAGLALLYVTNAGNVASLGAVILIMVRAGSYGQQVQSSYQSILQSLPFAERLQQQIARYRAARIDEPRGRFERIETIALRDVGFAYREGEPVLSEISFEAQRGEAVGIVGPSGAGKSTLVQIMLRLREPGSGEYAINGAPAAALPFAEWHRRVAYVPQKPQLLHASVLDNIRFFRDIDEAEVRRAPSWPGSTPRSAAGATATRR